jgi:hypothetical protein
MLWHLHLPRGMTAAPSLGHLRSAASALAPAGHRRNRACGTLRTFIPPCREGSAPSGGTASATRQAVAAFATRRVHRACSAKAMAARIGEVEGGWISFSGRVGICVIFCAVTSPFFMLPPTLHPSPMNVGGRTSTPRHTPYALSQAQSPVRRTLLVSSLPRLRGRDEGWGAACLPAPSSSADGGD